MIKGLEIPSCEERLRELISLEKLLESSIAEKDMGSWWTAS